MQTWTEESQCLGQSGKRDIQAHVKQRTRSSPWSLLPKHMDHHLDQSKIGLQRLLFSNDSRKMTLGRWVHNR